MLLPLGRTRKRIQVSAPGIAVESTRALQAEYSLSTNINTEIADRTSEDTRIEGLLAQEIGNRLSTDSKLKAATDQEILDRIAADNALSTRITNIEFRLDGKLAVPTGWSANFGHGDFILTRVGSLITLMVYRFDCTCGPLNLTQFDLCVVNSQYRPPIPYRYHNVFNSETGLSNLNALIMTGYNLTISSPATINFNGTRVYIDTFIAQWFMYPSANI